MASRFQDLIISDSDEDSNDSTVIQRRQQRSGDDRSIQKSDGGVTGVSVHTSFASKFPPSAPPQGSANRLSADGYENRALSSDGASISFQVAETPASVANPALTDQQTIDFSLQTSNRNESFARRVPSSAGYGRGTPGQGVSLAPTDESIQFSEGVAPPIGSQRSVVGSSTPPMSRESSGSQKKKTKVVRRKVVVRRRKGSDPDSVGEVVHAEEEVIRPGRSDVASLPSSRMQPAPMPPSRVSPRAVRAAASRSASRAATPRTPGGPLLELPPSVPHRSASLRGTPRASAAEQPNINTVSVPLSHAGSWKATPQTPAEDRAAILRAVSAQTIQTDDTISFQVDPSTAPDTANRGISLHRRPAIPSPSALDDAPTPYTMDESGRVMAMHRAKVLRTKTPDGRMAWMFVDSHRGDEAPARVTEIPAPPKKLSQRAQDIMAAKRRVVEESAKKRHADVVKQTTVVHHPHRRYTFPANAVTTNAVMQRHKTDAVAAQEGGWCRSLCDRKEACSNILRRNVQYCDHVRSEAEEVVRTLQPIQVGVTAESSSSCNCVTYGPPKDDALRQLLCDAATWEDGMHRFLNLQPMQLANVEVQQIADPVLDSPRRQPLTPSDGLNLPEPGQKPIGDQRGLATLGGLWCSVESLRDDGRPATRKDTKPPRRIMRVCGGQAAVLPRGPGAADGIGARCYELLLFPREVLSPSAVNYGSDGLTLGQLISPPASSFPLTPRIVDDPVALKEHKKRLLAMRKREIAMVNSDEDRATFEGDDGGAEKGERFLTLTMVTISSRQKYTVDLTQVLLPFRATAEATGMALAEVPRFCPFTVTTNRRLHGLSLSFSTKSAFMSAYKALLWATECSILDVVPTSDTVGTTPQLSYSKLRVTATTSPMKPWLSSLGEVSTSSRKEETFQGNCIDFAVLTLTSSPGTSQMAALDCDGPLTLDDFVILDEDNANKEEEDSQVENAAATLDRQRRRSSIFTSTLQPHSSKGKDNGDTVIGLTPFGVIRRAVHQKTSDVFDVRVVPRNRARMMPTTATAASLLQERNEAAAPQRTAKSEQEKLLQQDVEAAIMMEYVSRLPFQSRIYGVLVDDQRYYVFQEPWISALALEQSASGSVEQDAISYNEKLKQISSTMSVMSLKDFMHAILHSNDGSQVKREEAQLQIARVLAAQLLLLFTSIHGKGMLLGPCPPQRLLVRIETPLKEEEEEVSNVDTPPQKVKKIAISLLSRSIQIFVPDIGINTINWSYERQQCGVVEYLPPSYVCDYMLGDGSDQGQRPWTIRDDWWTYLTLCFELFAADGTPLVAPPRPPIVPTATPTLTEFSSPVDIFDLWRAALMQTTGQGSGTASEAMGARARHYVHQRILRSISRSLDGWISSKADAMEYFGTTAENRKGRSVRGVGQVSGKKDSLIGVSLSAAYLKSSREMPEDESSYAFQLDESKASSPAPENVLEEMPWLLSYRDFFDTILDAVFPPSDYMQCAVHGPPLRLLSHPFFQGVEMGQIFDGTHPLPREATTFTLRYLTKPKVQAALLAYRTRAYRGPLPPRQEAPLMIAASAFNATGSGATGAPLFLLSSPAYRDDPSAPEAFEPMQSGFEGLPDEGLVYSRANSILHSGAASPRSQSVTGALWGQQQKLRSLYNNEEWTSIAILESEVRGAFQAYQSRNSRARVDAMSGSAAPPMPSTTTPGDSSAHAQPMQGRGYSGETASVHSSHRHRDPRDYEQVTERRSTGSFHSNASGRRAEPIPAPFIPTGTAPFTEQPTFNSAGCPASSRHSAVATDTPLPRRQTPHQRPLRTPSRRSDFHEIERSLNELVVGTPPNHLLLSHRSNLSSDHRLTPLKGSTHSVQEASAHPSRHAGTDNSAAWPSQFLSAATLEKKGSPHRLSNPSMRTEDCMTAGELTLRSPHAQESDSRRKGRPPNTEQLPVLVHDRSLSDSEVSFVLVPSDDEDAAPNGVSQPLSSGGMRESPAPRNPCGSSHSQVASQRDTYFEF